MWPRGFLAGCETSLLQWSLCLFLCFWIGGVTGSKTWSKWFDGKPLEGVSNETLDRIQEIFSYDCDLIDDLQCRAKSPSATFANTTTPWQDGGSLRPACNSTSGIHCTLIDQTFWNIETTCSDFEIRFLCRSSADTTQVGPPSDNLSVNGGFIAMAAGLSVVVPLICVLVMQLRRAKREERERERRRPEVSGGESGGATDPPPSYEQVFGSNYHSASPVHSRNSSMDTLIQENETPRRSSGESGRDNAAFVGILGLRGGDVDDGLVSLQAPRSNQTSLNLGVATISGSHVVDLPVSLIASETVRLHEAVSSTSGWDNSMPSTSQTATHSSVLHSSDQPSSAPSTSSSTALPPPPPRSPPPPFSSWSFRNSNRNTGTGTSRIQETLRRLPGMHISIEDFFASLRGLQDNENPGPPPSYEEALKILESAAMAKERKSIIT